MPDLHILPLNIFIWWDCMGLSRKVLILWNVRVFVLLVLLFPVSDFIPLSNLLRLLIFLLLFISAFMFFYIRYKTCVFEATAESIKISTGIIIRKSMHIKYRHVVAANQICTPLSQHLELSNLIIYCEGATFLLPPLTAALSTEIEENIKTEVAKNET